MVDYVYNALSIAIRRNDYKLTKRMLKYSSTINKSDYWLDYILLIKALQRGRKQIAKLFLQNGYRVNKETATNFFHTPLYYAVKFGDLELVLLLLNKGALINGRDRNQETSLVLAMRQNKLQIVNLMLSQYFCQNNQIYDINTSQHYTAYYIACLTDNTTAMKNFIKKGIYVKSLETNHSWYKNKFILHFSVNHELTKLVHLLLKCGARITEKNSKGLTPLHLAFRNYMQNDLHKCSAEKIIDLILLSHNEKTENSIDNHGISHFHIACTRNNPETVKKFLNSGVDINTPISNNSDIFPGFTPLHCAVQFKCTSVVLLLLQNSADINAINTAGCTALHVATRDFSENDPLLVISSCYNFLTNDCQKIVDYILLAHNDLSENSVSPLGISHFHIACTRFNTAVVDNFIKRGVDVNSAVSVKSKILSGYTPLHCAVKCKNVTVVKLLLRHNANINAFNAQGFTPLHMAFVNSAKYFAREQTDAIIDAMLLMHTESTPNSTTSGTGLSHFHIACTRNIPHIVEIFIKQGEDINNAISVDSKFLSGCTPLHCAVKYNRAAVVKLLIQHNANVEKKNTRKLKPFQIACQISYNKMYEMIRDEIEVFQKNEEFSWRHSQDRSYVKCKYLDKWLSNRNDQLAIIDALFSFITDPNGYNKIFVQPLLFENFKEFKCMIIEEVIHSFVNKFTQNHIIDIVLKEFFIRRKEILKIFLSHNFDKNSQDSRGNTMLHILASNIYKDDGIVETAELLLSKGANINIKNNSGLTPLHIAIKNGYRRRDLVQTFLKHNANVNYTESEQNLTPLHMACMYYSKDPVQYHLIIQDLVIRGADVNARDNNGMTPLYTACATNSQSVTEILKYGADVNIYDNKGRTVLQHILQVETSLYTISGYDLFCVIRNHIKKLKVIGIVVCKRIETFCSELEQSYQSIYYNNNDKFLIKCQKEFFKIKHIQVDSYSSLYDIILKDPNKMANYVKNTTFTDIVNSDKFDEEFPVYGYLLKLQYWKGVQREFLLEPSKKMLLSLTKIELPDSCSEHILQYFNNQELEEFVKLQTCFSTKRS